MYENDGIDNPNESWKMGLKIWMIIISLKKLIK
jgi:hypothetical protein